MRNYYNIPEDEMKCLTANADDPRNGFLLQYDVHKSFDLFDWCLHPAKTGQMVRTNPLMIYPLTDQRK